MDKTLGKAILVLVMLGLLLTMTACTKSIADVKDDSFVDKKVAVRGVVEGSVKIGSFSGYSIRDETGSIGVVSDKLPKDGARVTARGTLKRLFAVYYIEVE